MTNAERTLLKKPKLWILNFLITIVLMLAFAYSFVGSQINWTRVQSFLFTLKDFLNGFTEINFEYLLGYGLYSFDRSIVYLALQTLAIGFIGTLIGAVLAIPFGFLASKNVVGSKVARIGELVLVIIRVFPEFILALILLKGFGINALTCVLTIGIHSIGMLGKLFSETIDNMDKSSIEALDAVGANTLQKVRFGILPQVMPDVSSIVLYRLDINVRSATVLGIIGAGGLGAPLLESINSKIWNNIATILITIIAMVLIVDAVSSYLRKKLV